MYTRTQESLVLAATAMKVVRKCSFPLWQGAHLLWAEQPGGFRLEFCPQERHIPHKRINKTPIFCQKNSSGSSLNLCTECNASLRVRFSCVNIGVQRHFSCLRACEKSERGWQMRWDLQETCSSGQMQAPVGCPRASSRAQQGYAWATESHPQRMPHQYQSLHVQTSCNKVNYFFVIKTVWKQESKKH